MNALKKTRIKTVIRYTWPVYIVVTGIIILFMNFIFGVAHPTPAYKTLTLFVSGEVTDVKKLQQDLLEKYEDKELKTVSTISSYPGQGQYYTKLSVAGYASADILIIPVSTLNELTVKKFAVELNEEIITLYYQGLSLYQQDEVNYGVKLNKEIVKEYMTLPDEDCYMVLNAVSENIGQYALKNPDEAHNNALDLVKQWGM